MRQKNRHTEQRATPPCTACLQAMGEIASRPQQPRASRLLALMPFRLYGVREGRHTTPVIQRPAGRPQAQERKEENQGVPSRQAAAPAARWQSVIQTSGSAIASDTPLRTYK